MSTIVLVGCGKLKLAGPVGAKDLYIGGLFRAARAYAEKYGDGWGILSAKHGLLMPGDVVAPYDAKLSAKGAAAWAERVSKRISELYPADTTFIVLAGRLYVEPLRQHLAVMVSPLDGMKLGQRLHWLKENT